MPTTVARPGRAARRLTISEALALPPSTSTNTGMWREASPLGVLPCARDALGRATVRSCRPREDARPSTASVRRPRRCRAGRARSPERRHGTMLTWRRKRPCARGMKPAGATTRACGRRANHAGGGDGQVYALDAQRPVRESGTAPGVKKLEREFGAGRALDAAVGAGCQAGDFERPSTDRIKVCFGCRPRPAGEP